MMSASQAEVVKNDLLDSEHESQYNHPSVSSYAFSSSAQTNATTSPHGHTQVQNLSSFSTLMVCSIHSAALKLPNLRSFWFVHDTFGI